MLHLIPSLSRRKGVAFFRARLCCTNQLATREPLILNVTFRKSAPKCKVSCASKGKEAEQFCVNVDKSSNSLFLKRFQSNQTVRQSQIIKERTLGVGFFGQVVNLLLFFAYVKSPTRTGIVRRSVYRVDATCRSRVRGVTSFRGKTFGNHFTLVSKRYDKRASCVTVIACCRKKIGAAFLGSREVRGVGRIRIKRILTGRGNNICLGVVLSR